MAIRSRIQNHLTSYCGHIRNPMQATKREFLWLIGLMLSFAHERPVLVLTSMDRVNPRLFDVMVAIGVLFILPRLRRSVRLPREFYHWSWIVTIFVFCALIYAVFLLPFEHGKFSLFYAAKYLEGLLVIYMALKIPLSLEQKKKMMWTITIGGIYVAAYCVFQFFTTTAGATIEIAPGKFITYYDRVLTGPLSYSYFHLAQFSALSAIVTFSLFETVRGKVNRWGVLALTGFVSWPLLFSGSRTGLALLVFSIGFGLLFVRRAKSRFVVLFLAIGIVVIVAPAPTDMNLNEFTTLSRLVGSEGGHNSVGNRLASITMFDVSSYKWGDLMPFIGGGFYVAPTHSGSFDNYRIGFGFHNTYLFAFEQGGIFAAIGFLFFLYAVILKLNRVKNTKMNSDRALAVAALSYMLASLPVYLAGQTFWMGFGTGHFNVFLLIVLLLALRPITMMVNNSAIPNRDPGYQTIELGPAVNRQSLRAR